MNCRRVKHISVHSKMMKTTRLYHNKRLRELFIKHYEPLWNGKVNKYWSLHINKNVLTELRLHLSWVLGDDVFSFNDERIGRKILKTLKFRNLGSKNVKISTGILNIT